MSRKPRIVVPGQPYHVVLRGNNRRSLFSSHEDIEQFYYLLGRALEGGDCALHANTPMKNHNHLLLTPYHPGALARVVKATSQRYAQERNGRRGASGKLFEERFFSKAVTSDLQLAMTTAYIELNPTKAGPTAARFEKWSTYGLHVGEPTRFPTKMWTPSAWYLALGETDAERQRAYRQWFAQRREELLTRNEVIDPLRASIARSALRERRPDGTSAL